MASRIEQALTSSVRDAMYHAAQVSPAALRALLERNWMAIEDDARLLDVVANELDRVSQLGRDTYAARDAESEAWLRHWGARFRRELDPEQAANSEAVQRELLRTTKDPTLEQWSLSELGLALESQGRTLEALETYERERSLVESGPADDWNASRTFLRLGLLRHRLGLAREAEASLGEAVRRARRARDLPGVIEALLARTEVLQDLGRWQEAARLVVQALALSRRYPSELLAKGHPPHDGLPVHRDVASSLLALLGRCDVRSFDSVARELDALTTQPAARVQVALTVARRAGDGGMLDRAQMALDAVEPVLVEDPSARQDADFERALLLQQLGRHQEARQLWERVEQQEVEQDDGETSWMRLAALSNRAEALVGLGAYDEAAAACEAAEEGWRQVGQDVNVARLRVQLAVIRLEQGRQEEAADLLQVSPELIQESATLALEHDGARARLLQRGGETDAALSLHKQVLRVLADRRDDRGAATHYQHVIELQQARGRWAAAGDAVAQTAERLGVLASRDGWRPSPSRVLAGAAYARGLKLFLDGQGDRREDLHAALAEFREAMRGDPDNPWFLLNGAFAAMEAEKWGRAQTNLRRLRQLSPEWIPGDWLEHEWRRALRKQVFGRASAQLRLAGVDRDARVPRAATSLLEKAGRRLVSRLDRRA